MQIHRRLHTAKPTDEVRVEHKKQESIEIKRLKMKSERRKIKAHKWEKT